MQTNFSNEFLASSKGQRADEILRKCVHCGFCNATCPTHQITGDELDGPRGRIYLLKQMFEDNEVSTTTLNHLDSCLSCLNCETTCPSGVQFGELAEFGKHELDNKGLRSWTTKVKRWVICQLFPYPKRFAPLYLIAKWLRLTVTTTPEANFHLLTSKSNSTSNKSVILLNGCIQSVVSPHINNKLKELLNNLGIQCITHKQAHCCGAIHHHNGAPEHAITIMKNNINHWWPDIEKGCQAIVMTASGCGSMIKDYHRLLENDSEYADKARRISELTQDASEFLQKYEFNKSPTQHTTVAFHPPCTLQHDQNINHVVETILQKSGYQVVPFKDKHLCCGSAGTYSLLQPEMANQLRKNKLSSIEQQQPDIIATANIGCLLHLQQGTTTPIKHWLELVSN